MNKPLIAPFPWQENQWAHLYLCRQRDCLPHALLFSGQMGLGKTLFAVAFAKALLCQHCTKEGMACHQCRNCHWVAARTHPDLLYLVPDKEGQLIKIEQIRAMSSFLTQTTLSPYKICIIAPAEALLAAAANALLKSLEEPISRCLFILIAQTPARLLATIRSRCQHIRFSSTEAIAKSWLKKQIPECKAIDYLYELANGAPLQALDYEETGGFSFYQCLIDSLVSLVKKEIDPSTLSENFLKTSPSIFLTCLMQLVSRILKDQFQSSISVKEKRVIPAFAFLGKHMDPFFLFHYFDKLVDLQASLARVALNPQLMIEDLFCDWFLQTKRC